MSLLKKKGKIMNEIEKELQEIREKKRVIPATFDPVFKSLLTNENNRGYLEDLISYVTKIPKEIISKNMVVVNNQLPIEKYNNKQLNTDILVEIEKNVINLEMNAQKEIGIFEKNAAYYQKLMVDQYKRSADYRNIKRVIQINFNDFKYFSDEDIIIKFQMTSENGLYIDPIYGEVYHVNLAILDQAVLVKGFSRLFAVRFNFGDFQFHLNWFFDNFFNNLLDYFDLRFCRFLFCFCFGRMSR